MLSPAWIEVEEIPKKPRIRLGIDRENLIHIHLQGVVSKDVELLRQSLIQLQHVFAVYYDHRRCSLFPILLPKIVIESVRVNVLDLLHSFVFPLLFVLQQQILALEATLHLEDNLCFSMAIPIADNSRVFILGVGILEDIFYGTPIVVQFFFHLVFYVHFFG